MDCTDEQLQFFKFSEEQQKAQIAENNKHSDLKEQSLQQKQLKIQQKCNFVLKNKKGGYYDQRLHQFILEKRKFESLRINKEMQLSRNMKQVLQHNMNFAKQLKKILQEASKKGIDYDIATLEFDKKSKQSTKSFYQTISARRHLFDQKNKQKQQFKKKFDHFLEEIKKSFSKHWKNLQKENQQQLLKREQEIIKLSENNKKMGLNYQYQQLQKIKQQRANFYQQKRVQNQLCFQKQMFYTKNLSNISNSVTLQQLQRNFEMYLERRKSNL